MVPDQPPRGISGKSGSVTPRLTRTLAPGSKRGGAVDLLLLAMMTFAVDLRGGRRPIPGILRPCLPPHLIRGPKMIGHNGVDRGSSGGRLVGSVHFKLSPRLPPNSRSSLPL